MELLLCVVSVAFFVFLVFWFRNYFRWHLPAHVINEKHISTAHEHVPRTKFTDRTVLPMEGKWEFYSAENFDEFLVALGVNFGLRQIAKCSRPTEIITAKEDGCGSLTAGYSIQNITPLKRLKMDFNLNQEFDHTEADGRKVKITVNFDNDTGVLTETQRCIKTSGITVIKRKLESDDTMAITMETNGITSVHRYTRAADDATKKAL